MKEKFKTKEFTELLSISFIVNSTQSRSDPKQTSFVGKHFLTLRDFNKHDIEQLLWTAADLKERIKMGGEIYQPLVGKAAALIFEKRSTRTRMSSETGILYFISFSPKDEQSILTSVRNSKTAPALFRANTPSIEILHTVVPARLLFVLFFVLFYLDLPRFTLMKRLGA